MNINERIDEAVRRITEGFGPMRIPADQCDADLVLTDAKAELAARDAEVASLRAVLRELMDWTGTTQDLVPDDLWDRCAALAPRAALAGRGPEATEQRGGLTVRAGAPVCSVCRDDATKRLECRACGGTGLDSLDDVRPDAPPSPDWRGLLEAVDRTIEVYTVAALSSPTLRALAAKRKEWP